jgi:hypothetical protein
MPVVTPHLTSPLGIVQIYLSCKVRAIDWPEEIFDRIAMM